MASSHSSQLTDCFSGSQTVLLALLATQATFLALRVSSKHDAINTKAALPGDTLALLGIIIAVPLSYLHHYRSIRPSTVLALHFSVLTLLNIARLRTLWQIAGARSNGLAIVFTVILVLIVAALGFESKSKNGSANSVKADTQEPFSGFWKRLTYAWLAQTFRRGYSTVLSVESLPGLDPQIHSRKLHLQLEKFWSKCASRHSRSQDFTDT
jgi:ATP-binding cassette subfamily C (CFTR/MRP) protein 1